MRNKLNATLFLSFVLAILVISSCSRKPKEVGSNKSGKDTLSVLIENLSSKITDHPSDPELLQQRAKYYLLDHQEKMAFADISKAVSLSPDKATYYITLSDIYLGMGKPDNCNEALLKALSLEPRNNPAILRIAKLSLISKDYKGAFDYIKKALEVQPVNPQAYFTRALALLEKGDTVSAVIDLKKTVDQDQGFYDAYVELGELYSMKKDPIAVDYFKNALRIKSDSRETMYMLGMFYQETGKYDVALETYARLAKIDSSFRDAPYNSAYIYLVYLHDFSKAAEFFSKALKCDPGYVEALFNRGYAYELAGEYEKASQDYKHVLTLRTNYQKAIDGLNRIDKSRGK